ncbi:MAG: hypothetical protein EZS28_025005, partial [Streblomastix strix]
MTQEELLQAALDADDDYSEIKAKRNAIGTALAQLIGYFNRDVKRNRELASLASAQAYASRYPNAPGFGGKNKMTGQRILKSRDTMQSYYRIGDYSTKRVNRGRDKKIAVDNSLLTPYQRY